MTIKYQRPSYHSHSTSVNDQVEWPDKVALFFVLIPFLIDYRFPAGQDTISILLYSTVLALSILSATALLFRHGLPRIFGINFVIISSFIFLVAITLSGLLRQQDPISVFRAISATILFVTTSVAVGALSRSPMTPAAVSVAAVKAGFLGVLIQFSLIVIFGRFSIETVRYEILTGASPLLSAYIITLLAFGGWSVFGIFLSLIHTGTVFLSVTRTQIAVAAVAALALVIALRFRMFSLRSMAANILVIPALIGAILLVSVAIPGAPLDRWSARLFETQQQHGGTDITFVTRIGEARFQMQQMSQSVTGFLFGFGAAAPSRLDDASSRIIQAIVGRGLRGADWNETGSGHNNYIGSIYLGGLFAGGMFIVAQFFGLFKSYKVIRLYTNMRRSPGSQIVVCAALGVPAYMAYGLLAGLVGQRSYSVGFAICLGLSFWVYDILARERNGKSSQRVAKATRGTIR